MRFSGTQKQAEEQSQQSQSTSQQSFNDTHLLAEYAANVELWKHDDSLRQQRTGNFLTINTALISVLALVVGWKPEPAYLTFISLAISFLGLSMCSTWRTVLVRNSEYIRLRRYLLSEIESKLSGINSFQRTYIAMNLFKPTEFSPPLGTFKISRFARGSSTKAENSLPVAVGLVWLFVLALTIAWNLYRN
jgi:hypothetical protein